MKKFYVKFAMTARVLVPIDAETIQLETNEPFQALLWSFCYYVFLFSSFKA